MKRQEIYDAWREKKQQVSTGEKFTDEVMSKIYLYQQNKRKPLFDIQPLIEFMLSRTIGKAALIAAGVVLGIMRIAFVFYAFLKC